MKRRDDSTPEGDRKKEDEMWMRLLKELNTEKERLEVAAEEPSEKDAAKNKTEQSEQRTEKKPQETSRRAPAEPNES